MWMPVAIDSTQPEERLRTIVKQVSPTLILLSTSNKALAERLHACRVFPLDLKALENVDTHLQTLLPLFSPSNMLAVIFTSGSTGVPKGVVLTHRNFATSLLPHQKFVNIEAASRVFDFTSHSFDFAWSNLCLILVAGGVMCIPFEMEREKRHCRSSRTFPNHIRVLNPYLGAYTPKRRPSLFRQPDYWRRTI
jgi:long-subunit acyl-CoA synthetase (AMP-forming)